MLCRALKGVRGRDAIESGAVRADPQGPRVRGDVSACVGAEVRGASADGPSGVGVAGAAARTRPEGRPAPKLGEWWALIDSWLSPTGRRRASSGTPRSGSTSGCATSAAWRCPSGRSAGMCASAASSSASWSTRCSCVVPEPGAEARSPGRGDRGDRRRPDQGLPVLDAATSRARASCGRTCARTSRHSWRGTLPRWSSSTACSVWCGPNMCRGTYSVFCARPGYVPAVEVVPAITAIGVRAVSLPAT